MGKILQFNGLCEGEGFLSDADGLWRLSIQETSSVDHIGVVVIRGEWRYWSNRDQREKQENSK